MNNDLISREALKKALSDKDLITWTHEYGDAIPFDWLMSAIDNAPTVESPEDEFKEKVLEVFNKYDVLVLYIGDKLEPVKNTSKQDCYNLIYDIGELIEWRRVLFKKYHGGVDNG